MHPDLSPHLHTPECNELIRQLHKCHVDHPYGKFFGKCSSIDLKLGRCLDKERDERRKNNKDKKKRKL